MDEQPITAFTGEHAFLSNFYRSLVEYEGVVYPTVEHAFQAAKTTDAAVRAQLFSIEARISPSQAKRRGRKLPLRADWQQVKPSVMRTLLRAKFSDPELKRRLLTTGDRPLIEGNRWGDRFWGVCKGKGSNHLGRLLMELRAELRALVRSESARTDSLPNASAFEPGKK